MKVARLWLAGLFRTLGRGCLWGGEFFNRCAEKLEGRVDDSGDHRGVGS